MRRALLYLGFLEEGRGEDAAREEPPARRAPPLLPYLIEDVYLARPRSYAQAKEIGDRLKASVPVLLDLRAIEPDLARRVIPFVCGLAYAREGTIERLARRIYLLTPPHYVVTDEDRVRLVRLAGVHGP